MRAERRAACSFLFAALFGGPVWAQAPLGATEIGIAHEQSRLDTDSPDWRETALSVRGALPRHGSLWTQWRQTQRFDLDDDEIAGGGGLDLGAAGGFSIDASYSDTHRVLAQYSGGAAWSKPLGGGFVFGAGARHARYSSDRVNVFNLSVERYWGDFRLAYGLFHGRLLGAESGLGHTLALDRYYGRGSRVGLTVSAGDEPARVSPAQVDVVEVRGVSLIGSHWLRPRWGVGYALGRSDQGDFYVRDFARLGLLYRF